MRALGIRTGKSADGVEALETCQGCKLDLAAGVPAATAEVGDKRGVLIGYTSGFAERAVTWDPWYGPEVVEGGARPLKIYAERVEEKETSA